MTNDIEHRFDMAMMGIYHCARNASRYTANRFLQMLNEHRGLETSRILLHSSKVSECYTALWERSRLDLTVEILILQPEWNDLSPMRIERTQGSVGLTYDA